MRDIRDIHNDAEADAVGVERFARAMNMKLAKKREEGRGGWNRAPYTVQPDRGDRVQRYGCSVPSLRRMLKGHINKGDMLDIANFAMMIWNREHPDGQEHLQPWHKQSPGDSTETMNHLNQEPLDFAAAVSLLRACRNNLTEEQRVRDNSQKNHAATLEELDAVLALLRELNDALAIPGWLQPRVDALLDRAEAE